MPPKSRTASPGAVARKEPEDPEVRRRNVANAETKAKAAPEKKKDATPAKEAQAQQAEGRRFFREKSIYALQPDARWLKPSLAFPIYACTLLTTIACCLFWEPSFKALRLQYTIVASGLLLYRMYYYARKEWMLFFIDLCFVNSILLIYSLWSCESGCSREWLLATYIVAQGPVAGATFPLQTPLTLHHPEAFESFFLHASPMWMAYAVRWRWPSLLGPIPPVSELLSVGFWRLYFPWSACYLVFLLLQPFLPDRIAGLETLMDGFILPASTAQSRLTAKRQEYSKYAFNVMKATILHAVLAGSGFLAAAMAYQYHEVQVVWIFCVLLGCLASGARFYYQSATPDYVPPGVYRGFRNMGLAWAMVLPTYLHCAGYV